MKKILAFPILPVVILGILGFVIIFILHKVHKKNRRWSRKAVNWYLLITWIGFALLGLVALVTEQGVYQLLIPVQGIMIGLGILHAYLLFSIFDWSDEESFWPEFFFTIATGCFAILGLVPAYWAVDRWLGGASGGSTELLPAFLWFPIPHLIHRTVHLWEQVPEKLFRAWRYNASPPRPISFHGGSALQVQVKLQDQWRGNNWIINKVRIPQNTPLEVFFRKFIQDYNQQYKDQPIRHLTHTDQNQSLGWVFVWKAGGSRARLEPHQSLPPDIRDNHWIIARRVLWAEDPTFREDEIEFGSSSSGSHDQDDGISITPLN